MVDALHFGQPGSTKMPAESSIFWRSGMTKNIENKCSTCTSCMSSSENLRYQLPSRKRPPLTVPLQEMQIDFSGKLHNKHLSGEPYIFVGIDPYSKWSVVRICKSTEKKDVVEVSESFISFHGVLEQIKSDRRSAFMRCFVKIGTLE